MAQIPTLAQIRLDRIETRAMEAHDAVASVARRASDLSKALGTAPASDIRSIEGEIARLQGRLAELQERHRHLANLTANVRYWMSGAAGDYEMAKIPKPTRQKGETLGQAVARVRAQIRELTAERVRIMQCGQPIDELKEQASAFVRAQQERGKPSLSFGHDRAFAATFNAMTNEAWTAQHNVAAYLAWIDGPALERRLHEMLDKAPKPALTMSSAERASKLAAIEAELLASERDEESLIEASEEEGPVIQRRLDADPRAVLGIALASVKRVKAERIRAA
ncbi:prefoldin subunit 5 [Bradyrhizobium sp. F1.13.1]